MKGPTGGKEEDEGGTSGSEEGAKGDHGESKKGEEAAAGRGAIHQ